MISQVGVSNHSAASKPQEDNILRSHSYFADHLQTMRHVAVRVFLDTLQCVTDMGGKAYFESNRKLPVKHAIPRHRQTINDGQQTGASRRQIVIKLMSKAAVRQANADMHQQRGPRQLDINPFRSEHQ